MASLGSMLNNMVTKFESRLPFSRAGNAGAMAHSTPKANASGLIAVQIQSNSLILLSQTVRQTKHSGSIAKSETLADPFEAKPGSGYGG